MVQGSSFISVEYKKRAWLLEFIYGKDPFLEVKTLLSSRFFVEAVGWFVCQNSLRSQQDPHFSPSVFAMKVHSVFSHQEKWKGGKDRSEERSIFPRARPLAFRWGRRFWTCPQLGAQTKVTLSGPTSNKRKANNANWGLIMPPRLINSNCPKEKTVI